MKKRLQKIVGLGLFMAGMIFSSQINAQNQSDRLDRDRIDIRQERIHEEPHARQDRKAVNHREGMRRGPQARANMHQKMRPEQRRRGQQMHRKMHRQMRPMDKQQSLDQAFKSGAINKKQYKKANRRLMKQRVSH